jgi:peptide/nickel transport system substrate-binding protein
VSRRPGDPLRFQPQVLVDDQARHGTLQLGRLQVLRLPRLDDRRVQQRRDRRGHESRPGRPPWAPVPPEGGGRLDQRDHLRAAHLEPGGPGEELGQGGANAILEALHYAYDKQAITARVYGGLVQPICNYVSPLAWFYKDTGRCESHNTARANSILDAAGFTKGSDGIRKKNGKKLELLACTSASRQFRIDTLTLLASQVRQVGIKLDVKAVPSSPNLFGGWSDVAANTPCNLTHGNFNVVEFAWISQPEPQSIYGIYYSTYDPSKGDHSGANLARVNSKEVDQILETITTSADVTVVRAAMYRFQDLYVDPANAFPEIPLYFWKTVLLKNAKMHNVVNNATAATGTWNIVDWWRSP